MATNLTCPACGKPVVKAGFQGRATKKQLYQCKSCFHRTVNPTNG